MDWTVLKENCTRLFGKYKYVVLILVVGMILMALPDADVKQAETVPSAAQTPVRDAEEELEQILSFVAGVGKVKVLLTQQIGGETVYQTDEDRSADGSVRSDTVIVTDENRVQKGLVRSRIGPVYQGAIVVCQGAEHPAVRLAVVEAVADVTGLGTDRITVVKMK